MKKLIVMFLIMSVNLFGQQKDADKILKDVIRKFDKVEDYQADISLKLDISFAKIPDTKAKIYFKKPDKVKIDSKGFAIVPRQSINFSPASLLKGDYTAIYVKTETVDNNKLDVIKIIPNSDSTDIILSTLWIDENQSLIRKVVTNGKKSGTTTIEMSYDNPSYSLPSKIVFNFNVSDVDVPQQMQQQQPMQQQNQNQNDARHRGFRSISGKVIVTYSNYKINQGIPDSIFEDKTKNN